MMLTTPAVDAVAILSQARPARNLRSVAQPRAPSARVRRRSAGGHARRRNRNWTDRGRVRALVTVAGNPVLSAPERAAPRSRARHARARRLDRWLSERDDAPRARPPAAGTAAVARPLRPRAVRLLGAQRREVFGAGHPATGVGAARLGDSRPSSPAGCSSRVRFAGSPFWRARQVAARADRRRAATHRPSPADAREAAPVSARDRSRTARARALRDRIATRDRMADVAPDDFLREARARLFAEADRETTDELVLIGRRQLRDNNSWMHNARRLVKGPPRCTLLVHPTMPRRAIWLLAMSRGSDRRRAPSSCRRSDRRDAPGVVSLPHGWGHDRDGTASASRASMRVRASTT